jgi:hypothetical protein
VLTRLPAAGALLAGAAVVAAPACDGADTLRYDDVAVGAARTGC